MPSQLELEPMEHEQAERPDVLERIHELSITSWIEAYPAFTREMWIELVRVCESGEPSPLKALALQTGAAELIVRPDYRPDRKPENSELEVGYARMLGLESMNSFLDITGSHIRSLHMVGDNDPLILILYGAGTGKSLQHFAALPSAQKHNWKPIGISRSMCVTLEDSIEAMMTDEAHHDPEIIAAMRELMRLMLHQIDCDTRARLKLSLNELKTILLNIKQYLRWYSDYDGPYRWESNWQFRDQTTRMEDPLYDLIQKLKTMTKEAIRAYFEDILGKDFFYKRRNLDCEMDTSPTDVLCADFLPLSDPTNFDDMSQLVIDSQCILDVRATSHAPDYTNRSDELMRNTILKFGPKVQFIFTDNLRQSEWNALSRLPVAIETAKKLTNSARIDLVKEFGNEALSLLVQSNIGNNMLNPSLIPLQKYYTMTRITGNQNQFRNDYFIQRQLDQSAILAAIRDNFLDSIPIPLEFLFERTRCICLGRQLDGAIGDLRSFREIMDAKRAARKAAYRFLKGIESQTMSPFLHYACHD